MPALEFYSRVVTLIKEKNISIAQFERNVGFPIGTIKSWKKAIPAGEKIKIVADNLDVSTDYLFSRIENRYAHKVDSLTSNTQRILEACEQNHVDGHATNIIVALIEAIRKEYV